MEKKQFAILFKQISIDDDFWELIPVECLIGKVKYNKLNNEMSLKNDESLYYCIDKKNHSLNGFGYPCVVTENDDCSFESLQEIFLNIAKQNRYFKKIKNSKYYFYRLDAEGFLSITKMNKPYNPIDEKIIYSKKMDKKDISSRFISQIINLSNLNMSSEEIEIFLGNEQLNLNNNISIKTVNKKDFDIKDVYEKLRKIVISQDEAMKDILITIKNNIEKCDLGYPISNILLIGSTGVGKTFIVQELCNLLKIPFVKVDINNVTEMGYVGENVTDCLEQLYLRSNCDKKIAERGIVFIDEIDKISRNSSSDHIKTIGVQNALLKLLEGNEYKISVGKNTDGIIIDTSKITFIAAGAFSNITSPIIDKSVGFISYDKKNNSKNIESKLIDYGMENELIGRFSKIVELNNLDNEALKSIIFSKKSMFNYYLDIFKKNNINFVYNEEFINSIAKTSLEKMGGARGLNKILEYIFNECLWEIYSNEKCYSELVVNEEIVNDNKKYILK